MGKDWIVYFLLFLKIMYGSALGKSPGKIVNKINTAWAFILFYLLLRSVATFGSGSVLWLNGLFFKMVGFLRITVWVNLIGFQAMT